MTAMPFHDFELAYEALAQAIDEVRVEDETVFLTKLTLTLAHKLGDLPAFRDAIRMAQQDLPTADATSNT